MHALVIVSGTGLNGEPLHSFSFLSVANVVQLKRILINAERAGITHFTLVCEDSNKFSILELIKDKRIQSRIDLVTENSKPDSYVAEEYIVIQSNLLAYSTSIKSFIDISKVKNTSTVLCDDKERYGLLKVSKVDAEKIINGRDLRYWIKQQSEKSVDYVTVEEGYYINLSEDKKSLKQAEDLIFSNVGKTATGWIARNINGRISLPISRQLVKTSLTPNMVSLLINMFGVLCGPFYAMGHPVLGAMFMQIATILDRCDGEVARVKLMETKKGQWVDTISDQFTVLSFYIGLPIGFYYHGTQDTWILAIGAINILLYIFFLIWSFYFLVNYTNSGSLVAYFEVDKIVDEKNTSILRKFAALLRPAGRRNVYSLGFFIMAVISGYGLVFLFATIGIILFFVHQFEDMIRMKNQSKETLK